MRFRGPIGARKAAALRAGDLTTLFAINRAEFGGFNMMADDDGDDDAGSDGGGDGDDGGGDDGTDDDGDSGEKDSAALARQLADMEKRMKAADKRADAAEKKIKEAEKAEQDELTRAKGELEEAQAELTKRDEEIKSLRLNNAFLTANKITWHDPDTALSLAASGGYLEGVTDDDGVVDKKALGSALDKLAKEKKYLVNAESKADDDEPDGPSGEPAGGRSKNAKDREARKKQLSSRFPVLNR